MLGFNDIRKGKIVVLDGSPYIVASAEFLRKQQRRPVMRTILKHLVTGAAKEHSFQQSDRVEEADVQSLACQYLYKNGESYVFMDQIQFSQYELDKEAVGSAVHFLLEGQEAELVLFDGRPVNVELPIKIERKVIEAPPGVRGNTSTNVMKDIVIEGGVKMKAPLFVSVGDVIRIDTRTGTYVEKA